MDTKSNKNYGTTFFALAFIVAIFFELYFIMTNPYNYFMLIGIGIIMIILGYLTFDSIAKAKEAALKQQNEQNEMMLKASKAIYLATKRNTQEAQKQHAQNIKAIEYMMNNMISNEKDMVNALISKNEEIAAKQITSKPEGNDMSSLIEQLSASNAKLAKEVQSAITVNELVKANADLVKNVREVLGNSQSSLDNSNIKDYVNSAINQNPVAASTVTPAMNSTDTDSVTAPAMNSMDTTPVASVAGDTIEGETSTNDTVTYKTDDISEPKIIQQETYAPAAPDYSDMEQEDDEFDFESFEIPEDADDVQISDSETASSKEIIDDVNVSALNDMVETEGNTIAPDVSDELDKEMSSTPSDSVMQGLDDNPNRQLTEEEIAALFANL